MIYVIKKKDTKVFSFLLDAAGHAVEIHADDPAQGPKIGDIYIGLVQKVAKNINAAFVEIIPGVNGYLPFDEIVDPIFTSKGPSSDIQAGDQVVVQITRDAFGHKDMSLSTKLTMRGRYVVLTSGGVGLGVSRKIPEERRQELKDRILSSDEFGKLQSRIGQCSVVVRTNAGELLSGDENLQTEEVLLVKKEVLREITDLEAQMTDLKLKAPYRSVHTCLKKQPARWLSRVMQLSLNDVSELVTDDMSLYRQILDVKPSALKARLYEDSMVSMEKVYSLERELSRALSRHVDLKSGADLVIESTEALHIIDVNSGRSQSKKSKEEALLNVNLEAAAEAARQIRLRNLSGIIVIDFINLKMQKNSLRILNELKKAVSSDPVRTQVVDMTKLGLVEMTRQKIEASLAQTAKGIFQQEN